MNALNTKSAPSCDSSDKLASLSRMNGLFRAHSIKETTSNFSSFNSLEIVRKVYLDVDLFPWDTKIGIVRVMLVFSVTLATFVLILAA